MSHRQNFKSHQKHKQQPKKSLATPAPFNVDISQLAATPASDANNTASVGNVWAMHSVPDDATEANAPRNGNDEASHNVTVQKTSLHIETKNDVLTTQSTSPDTTQRDTKFQNSTPERPPQQIITQQQKSLVFEHQSDWSAVDAEEDMDFDDLESFLKDTIVDVNAVKEKIASEPPTPHDRMPVSAGSGRGVSTQMHRERSISPPPPMQQQPKILSRNAGPPQRKPLSSSTSATPPPNAWASRDLPHREKEMHHERTPSPQQGARPRSSERGRILQPSSPPRQRGGPMQRGRQLSRGNVPPPMDIESRREPLRRESTYTPKEGAYRLPPRDAHPPINKRPPSAGRRGAPYAGGEQSGRVLDAPDRRGSSGGPLSHRRSPYTPLAQQQRADFEREITPNRDELAPVHRAAPVVPSLTKPETPTSASKLPITPNLTVQQLKEQQKVMDEMAEQRRQERLREEQEEQERLKRLALEKLAKLDAEEEEAKREQEQKKRQEEEEKVRRLEEEKQRRQREEEQRFEAERRLAEERLRKLELEGKASKVPPRAEEKTAPAQDTTEQTATPTSATSTGHKKRDWKEKIPNTGDSRDRRPRGPRRDTTGNSAQEPQRNRNPEDRPPKRFGSRSRKPYPASSDNAGTPTDEDTTPSHNKPPYNKRFSRGSDDDTRRRGERPSSQQGDHRDKKRNFSRNRNDRQSTPTSGAGESTSDSHHEQDDVLQRVEDTPPKHERNNAAAGSDEQDDNTTEGFQRRDYRGRGGRGGPRGGRGSRGNGGGRGRGSGRGRGRRSSFSQKNHSGDDAGSNTLQQVSAPTRE